MTSLVRDLITAAAVLTLSRRRRAQDAQKPDEKDKDTAPKELKGLKYRPIGPAAGGRVSRAAGVPGDPTTYYAATASGGVWKSTDGGVTWKSVFDDQPVSSIGSLAIAPSDPNIVYVGSGEANIRGNVAEGNGIYKTIDGGKTWTHVWKQRGQIGTMVVHPTNPDVAFAAVLGRPFGANPERGVYRTKDGGKTWQQVLKKDADTGASDIAMDPNNPAILFAGFWQARRYPWDMTSGGPGSGLHVSRDGGDTWTQLTKGGLPEGPWGKVGVAIARSDSRRVYALIEAEKGGLYKSDDGGESWELASANRAIRQRAWYYTTLTVNPANADEIWFPQVPMLQEHRRRQDDSVREGLSPRRSPRPLDRSEESEADDLVQRRRRGHHAERRRNLVRAARSRSASSTTCRSTTACPIASRVRCRTSAPRRGRASIRAAASRSRTGGVSAAARPGTSSPTGAIRTSSTPASISASSPATIAGPASHAMSARGRRTPRAKAAKT